MDDEQSQRKHLKPDEIARIEREERERLEGWIKNLSPEEAEAWLDAHEDDLETGMEAVMQEKADFVAIRQAIAPIIQEHPNMEIGEAKHLIRNRERKTLAETEGLDAFDRIMNKHLGTIRAAGKTYTWKGI
jgi:hypothetical protein